METVRGPGTFEDALVAGVDQELEFLRHAAELDGPRPCSRSATRAIARASPGSLLPARRRWRRSRCVRMAGTSTAVSPAAPGAGASAAPYEPDPSIANRRSLAEHLSPPQQARGRVRSLPNVCARELTAGVVDHARGQRFRMRVDPDRHHGPVLPSLPTVVARDRADRPACGSAKRITPL